MRSQFGRALALLGLAILLAGTAVLAGTARLFVWPTSSSPSASNAIVVLAGDHGERLERALQLMHQRLASTLVLAGNPDFQGARDLCSSKQQFEVVCLTFSSDSTRTEARAVSLLGSTRGWTRITVVTTTSHVVRARVLFERCFDGSVDLVAASPRYGARQTAQAIIHEWLGLTYAEVVDRTC